MTSPSTSRARRALPTRATAVLGTLALAGVLAGCSGGASSASATAASTSSATASTNAGGQRGAGFAAYSACLSQHGITLPSGRASDRPTGQFTAAPTARPSGGFGFAPPSGVSSSAFAAAQQACASLRPTGRFGGAAGFTALAAFRSCMSDHGVSLPSTGPVLGTLSTTDPKVSSALSICRPLLPSRPGAPSPTTTTSP